MIQATKTPDDYLASKRPSTAPRYHQQAKRIAEQYSERALIDALAWLRQVDPYRLQVRMDAVFLDLETRP